MCFTHSFYAFPIPFKPLHILFCQFVTDLNFDDVQFSIYRFYRVLRPSFYNSNISTAYCLNLTI